MKLKLFRAAAAVLALAALGAGAAHARGNVYWSVGVNAAPGVALGIGNVAPMVMAPQPVYYEPAPVYYAPAPVYVARPAPVYYAPPVYYYGPRGHHRHYRHRY